MEQLPNFLITMLKKQYGEEMTSKIIEGYEKLNSQFSSIYISGTKLYPHLEYPDKVLKILETKL